MTLGSFKYLIDKMCLEIIYILNIRGAYNKFPDFFIWALLLIVHTWNSSPLRCNLLRLQCTCCTIPTTSGTPHGIPLVWACQWPSSQPLSSLQLSHNELMEWAKVTESKVWAIGSVRNCPDAHLAQIVCDKDGVVEMPRIWFEKC